MKAFARRLLRASASLGVFAFWACMFMAARNYPSDYDWQYMTISSLVYTDRNPNGYLWAWSGIVLCGLGGLLWALQVASKRSPLVAEPRAGTWALGVGYLSMIACALLPEGLLPIPKAHELLALIAFIGICIGIVHTTFKEVQSSVRAEERPVNTRALAAVLAASALSPIVLAALAQSYVSHELPELPWVNVSWRARGIPVYLSFAFWEWFACGLFSIYMVVLSLTTIRRRNRPPESAKALLD